MRAGKINGLARRLAFLLWLAFPSLVLAQAPAPAPESAPAPGGAVDAAPAQPGDLVVNGGFEDADRAIGWPRQGENDAFVWHRLVGPSTPSLTVEQRRSGERALKVQLIEGGGAFLHTRAFDVEPGALLEAAAWVFADGGRARLELLWWREYDALARPSATHRAEGQYRRLKEKDWIPLRISARVPDDARRAFLRVTLIGGESLVLDDLSAVLKEAPPAAKQETKRGARSDRSTAAAEEAKQEPK